MDGWMEEEINEQMSEVDDFSQTSLAQTLYYFK